MHQLLLNFDFVARLFLAEVEKEKCGSLENVPSFYDSVSDFQDFLDYGTNSTTSNTKLTTSPLGSTKAQQISTNGYSSGSNSSVASCNENNVVVAGQVSPQTKGSHPGTANGVVLTDGECFLLFSFSTI